jgi:hypothetical protein
MQITMSNGEAAPVQIQRWVSVFVRSIIAVLAEFVLLLVILLANWFLGLASGYFLKDGELVLGFLMVAAVLVSISALTLTPEGRRILPPRVTPRRS